MSLVDVLHWVRSWQWGSVVAWVAVAPSALSVIASRRQARNAVAAATDAKEALALALRPIMAFGPATRTAMKAAEWGIGMTNNSAFAAVDVTVKVTAKSGRVVGDGTSERIAGKVPGTLLGDDDLVVDVEVPSALQHGENVTLTATARFADERGLQRWEQRGQLTWRVECQNASSEPYLLLVGCDPGTPVKYNPPST